MGCVEDVTLSVGFEVLTAVVMKSAVFWVIMLDSALNVNRCFGGTCRLHLQGLRKAKQETCSFADFLLGVFFNHKVGGDVFFRNVG